MYGAHAASGGDLLAEGLAGAVDADCSIVGGDACMGGESGEGLVVEVDGFNRFAILRFQCLQQAVDTLADAAVEGLVGVLVGFQVVDQLICDAGRGGTVAVVIDDGVAKEAVEPGDDVFFVAQCVTFFEATDESRLKNIFGGGFGIDSCFEESKELACGFPAGDRRLAGRVLLACNCRLACLSRAQTEAVGNYAS